MVSRVIYNLVVFGRGIAIDLTLRNLLYLQQTFLQSNVIKMKNVLGIWKILLCNNQGFQTQTHALAGKKSAGRRLKEKGPCGKQFIEEGHIYCQI